MTEAPRPPLERTVLVIPCFNEEQRLDPEAFAAFVAEHPGIDFVFVDDGSRDGTARVLSALCARDPQRLEQLSSPENRGKGSAVRKGVLHALASGADCVGYWDADLATPLTAIPTLRQVLSRRPEISLAMGARVQLLGRHIERRAARHYLGRVFATVVSTLLALRVYDTQCGAKLFRAGPEAEAVFRDPFLAGWIFDVEVIARMIQYRRRQGLPGAASAIVEVPLDAWRDVVGSKLRPSHYLAAPIDLARIWLRYLRP